MNPVSHTSTNEDQKASLGNYTGEISDDESLESLCDFVGRDKAEITTLSNGKRALKDIKSGELIFVEDVDEYEDATDEDESEDDQTSEPEDDQKPGPAPEVPPLVLELHKDQTPKAIEAMLLKTSAVLTEKADMITRVQVVIEGFGADISPAMYRPAKKRYIKACEMGLLALLHAFDFKQEVITVYSIAYRKARIKDGNVVVKGLTQRSDHLLFAERMMVSQKAYQNLVESHSSMGVSPKTES